MMDAQKATAGAVQSVERAFDILEIMASAGGSTGVSELADLSFDCGARAADRGVLVSKGRSRQPGAGASKRSGRACPARRPRGRGEVRCGRLSSPGESRAPR
jgi:hypothetical protein